MELSSSVVGLLVICALVGAVAAVALSTAALLGQRRVRRAYAAFSQGSRDDVLTLLERHIEEVRGLRGDVDGLRLYCDNLRELIRAGVSRVGTVRYDAFEEMGGRLSFSAALLDEHGDGVVITSMNGRNDSRTYIKPVLDGDSKRNLSEEEHEAISRAMDLHGRVAGRRSGRRQAGPAQTSAAGAVPQRPHAIADAS